MKRSDIFFKPLLVVALSIALFSCGNSTDTRDDTKKADTAASVTPPPTPPPFSPFDIMETSLTVKDFDKWKPMFEADSPAQISAGLKKIVVGRESDKPNNTLIVMQVSDLTKAKAFSADPRLKTAMQKSGVISKPETDYFHVIRYNPNSKEKQWVEITHKVKDFAAWLKVYDGEGTTTREGQGMVDVALARGIPDSNIVKIVFDIKDSAKAKMAIMSDDKKKLMMSAGVEGKPKIVFYKSAD